VLGARGVGGEGVSHFKGFLLLSIPSRGGDETNVAFLAAVRGGDICMESSQKECSGTRSLEI
jgi:hypothetical protein